MPMMSFGIIILLSGIVCFSGCDQSQQTTTDPNMLVAEYPDDTNAVALTEESQEQAVSMYVDAMMLNDLNEREQAIRKLNLALELDPKFSLAYSLKGDILQGMEKYEPMVHQRLFQSRQGLPDHQAVDACSQGLCLHVQTGPAALPGPPGSGAMLLRIERI
jgi:hypothetical protein